MTNRQIEQSREVRLWIGQIIVPGVLLASTMLTIPGVREAVVEKVGKVKQSVKNLFKKES